MLAIGVGILQSLLYLLFLGFVFSLCPGFPGCFGLGYLIDSIKEDINYSLKEIQESTGKQVEALNDIWLFLVFAGLVASVWMEPTSFVPGLLQVTW